MSALSRRLVSDEHAAEDLVQEAQLAGLTRPPGVAVPLRAWFSGVLRNLSNDSKRRGLRREYHEGQGASSIELPATDEVAARLETQRILAGLVEALKDPYRQALYMRFYEGLAPREIARALGLPLATVKTHLRRGLEQLRSRLDAAHDGQRENWCAVLALPFAQHQPASTASTGAGVATVFGGSVVLSKFLIVLAGGLLALGWYVVDLDGSGTAPAPSREKSQVAGLLPDQAFPPETVQPAPAPSERADVSEPRQTQENPRETLEQATTGWMIHGRVTSQAGTALTAASVELGLGMGDPLLVRCDDDGRYSALLPLPPELSPHALVLLEGQAICSGFRSESHSSTALGTPASSDAIALDLQPSHELNFSLSATGVLRGQLLDERGQPAGGVLVGLRDQQDRVQPISRSDEDGHFSLACESAGTFTLLAGSSVHGFVVRGPYELGPGQSYDSGQIQLPGSASLRGGVAFADGTPLREESFVVTRLAEGSGSVPELPAGWQEGQYSVCLAGRTDGEGEFELHGLQEGSYELRFDRLWAGGPRAISGPHHTAEFADIQLDVKMLRVSVVDTDGLAVPGARVSAVEGKRMHVAETEGILGDFVFAVEPGLYRVGATVPGAEPVGEEIEITGAGHLFELELTLDFDPKTGQLELEVVDEQGRPMHDWKAGLFRPGARLVVFDDLRPDDAGQITGIPVGDYQVRVLPGREQGAVFFDQMKALVVRENQTTSVAVQLIAGGRVELELVGSDDLQSVIDVEITAIPADGRSPRRLRYLYPSPPVGSRTHQETTIGAVGRTDLLRAGAYEFTFRASGYQTITLPIRILAGEILPTQVLFEPNEE